MKQKIAIVAAACLITVFYLGQGQASVEWKIDQILKLEKPPLDIAVALSGRWIYVLTTEGNLKIYTPNGRLEDTISVGKHIEGLRIGPWEGKLILTSKTEKTVQLLSLSFIQKINTQGSPVKGNPNAEVEIITFGDFQ